MENCFAWWYRNVQTHFDALPYVAQVLRLLKHPIPWYDQALYKVCGHYRSMLHFFAQSKNRSTTETAHIYKFNMGFLPMNSYYFTLCKHWIVVHKRMVIWVTSASWEKPFLQKPFPHEWNVSNCWSNLYRKGLNKNKNNITLFMVMIKYSRNWTIHLSRWWFSVFVYSEADCSIAFSFYGFVKFAEQFLWCRLYLIDIL